MYDKKDIVSTSKYIAYLLRHHPESARLDMDSQGWVEIEQLISGVNEFSRFSLDEDKLRFIVLTDKKGRYVISSNGKLVRATQGHSVSVDVGLQEAVPAGGKLWHGTVRRACEGIEACGLLPMTRLHVHMFDDIASAIASGSRRSGECVVYVIDAERMVADGFKLYRSENGVWLADAVPIEYIEEVDLNST